MLVQKTACVNGCSFCKADARVRCRALASALASRVCWLKRRMRFLFVFEEGEGAEGGGGIWEANQDAATSMLSSVWPPSMCHAMFFSRRVSQRPGQRTSSRPRMNSVGSLSLASPPWWPRAVSCASAMATARLAFVC